MMKKILIIGIILSALISVGSLTYAATPTSTTMKVEGIKVPKDTYTKLTKIPNKDFVLLEILQAKQKIGTGEVQKQLDSMQKKVVELSKGAKTQDQKLSRIYERIITNISYDDNRQNDIEGVYANSVGIMSYRNKKGICGGISHIFGLMAFYAGEIDIRAEQGKVDGLSHVRTKIGNFYYDPTFDIGLRRTNITTTGQQYYFKLPLDVMLLDRNLSGKPIVSKEKKLEQAKKLLKVYKQKYPIISYLLSVG